MRELLSDPDRMANTLLDDDATELDRAKYNACGAIVRYLLKNKLKQKELADLLQIDEARMSEILHYKVERFTFDRLLGYAVILYPKMKVRIDTA